MTSQLTTHTSQTCDRSLVSQKRWPPLKPSRASCPLVETALAWAGSGAKTSVFGPSPCPPKALWARSGGAAAAGRWICADLDVRPSRRRLGPARYRILQPPVVCFHWNQCLPSDKTKRPTRSRCSVLGREWRGLLSVGRRAVAWLAPVRPRASRPPNPRRLQALRVTLVPTMEPT